MSNGKVENIKMQDMVKKLVDLAQLKAKVTNN